VARGDLLTEEEYARFAPSRAILRALEECRSRFGLSKADTTVLDFGCGRGRMVCFLYEQGYNVFGVDPDPKALAGGRELLLRHGLDVDERVKLIAAGGQLPFHTETFHFVISDQVLEHVERLEPAVAELARVTRLGGAGMHRFPARFRLVEPHISLPLVHWLPKTRARGILIAFWLLLGADPGWDCEGSIRYRAGVYYRYMVRETYYRSTRRIRARFERAGFSARYAPARPATIVGRARASCARRFRSVVLLTTRDG
jgi:SAM-dependent methyltransferase